MRQTASLFGSHRAPRAGARSILTLGVREIVVTGQKNQKCNKCEQVFPLTREYFGQTKQKSGRVTFRQVCRACIRANTARHYAEAPEKVIARVARRKLQDESAKGSCTPNDIAAIRRRLSDRCRYCNTALNGGGEIEHMTPISRSGSHWPQNLTLACFQCNKEKHGKTEAEYVKWRRERGLSVRTLR